MKHLNMRAVSNIIEDLLVLISAGLFAELEMTQYE